MFQEFCAIAYCSEDTCETLAIEAYFLDHYVKINGTWVIVLRVEMDATLSISTYHFGPKVQINRYNTVGVISMWYLLDQQIQ